MFRYVAIIRLDPWFGRKNTFLCNALLDKTIYYDCSGGGGDEISSPLPQLHA
jgi:hypothetical protein